MHRNTLIEKIKKEIYAQFDTNKQAAASIGISEVHLSRVLNEDHRAIPKPLLDWIGYEGLTITTYHKIKEQK